MFKNKKFASHAIIFMVLGIVYMFLYSGLQNDQINVLTPYLQETRGWTDLQITNPMTLGAIIAIFAYAVFAGALVKFGVKKVFIPTLGILAAACFGIAICGNNYALYFISLLIIRVMVIPLQLGGFALCANWFIKYRGRVMGIITIGSPLFSIFGISLLTSLVEKFGLGAYFFVGGLLILISVITSIATKDTPEELGLFPDGSVAAPASESNVEEIELTAKEVYTDKNAWKIIVSYGTLTFVIMCMMSYMAVRYISLSGPDDVPNLFVTKGLAWLSVGAACGIPMSFVLGFIDDKIGTIKASIILNLLFFAAVVPLAIMPIGGNDILMAVWAFGVACMTGGLPTMDPCITSYVYGRKKYMSANKWIFPVKAAPTAFALAFMGFFNQTGNLDMAYYILIALLFIPLVIFFTMGNVEDANKADRGYSK